MKCRAVVLASAGAMLLSPAAFAQDEAAVSSADGSTSYPAAYFATYAPVTAFDMISRLPGFSFRDGGGARGFGVNAGNVVINGRRPTIKSETLESLLRRIPAKSVQRVEIIDQPTSSDLAGLGRVANVVLTSETAVSGTYSLAASVGESGDPAVELRASVTVRGIDDSLTLSVTHIPDVSRTKGPEFVTNAAGGLIERRQFDGRTYSNPTAISVAASRTFGSVTLNGNGKMSLPRSRSVRDGDFFGPANQSLGTEAIETFAPASGADYELGGDIGVDWSKSFSSSLVALFNGYDQRSTGRIERSLPTGATVLRQTENIDIAHETVVRLKNSLTLAGSLQIQAGAELARNRLDATFRDQSGALAAASVARVRETRFEPFVSASWSPSPKLQLEAGLIAERSILDVVSAGTKKRRFLFWKPSLVADWTLSKHSSIEFKIAREAAQLDFNDFATSVDLAADGQVDLGNRELVPERTWTFAATLQQRFWNKGSLELLVSYVDVKDFQDLVPVSLIGPAGNVIARFDGPGNIGKGQRWNVEAFATIPLDRVTRPLGVSGFELELLAHYHGSRVTDPVTGAKRLQSNTPEFHYYAGLRQDLARQKLAWGFQSSWGKDSVGYFVNQTNRVGNNFSLNFFLEYRGFKRGTLRFDMTNLTDRPIERERLFYVDTRASGVIAQRFFRDQRRDRRFALTFSSTF